MNDPVTLGREGSAPILAAAWASLLDYHQGKSWTAWVDAFSDYDANNEMPDEVRAAMNTIRARTKTGMAVELSIDQPGDRQLAEAFGPYSIHATVGPAHRDDRFGVHDGTYLWFTVERTDLDDIRNSLEKDGVPLGAFEVLPDERPRAVLAVALTGLIAAMLVVAWLLLS